jgi:predicted permease
VLVTGQIATSIVLLVCAALLIRSVAGLSGRELGYRTEGVLTVRIEPPESRYASVDARAVFADRLLERLGALPGVDGVTATVGVPPDFGNIFGDLVTETGVTVPTGSSATSGTWVDSAFFAVLGVPIRQGRSFEANSADRNEVIVNETLARMAWPGETAIGKRLRSGDDSDDASSIVVGVVGDVRSRASLHSAPQLYYPIDFAWGLMTIGVRVREGDPLALVDAVRAAIAELDPVLPIHEFSTVEARLAQSIASDRFLMTLLTLFASLAVALSAVGLYGVVSQSVARRTREIGIRITLGARPGEVRGLILRQGMLLTGIGSVLGGLAAIGAVRVLASRDAFAGLLRGVEPYDFASFAIALVAAATAAALATIVPAARASSVDPVHALRSE